MGYLEVMDALENEYEGVVDLGFEHFAVCKMTGDNILKWGIVRVHVDGEFKYISRLQTLIVPFIYDSISFNFLKTATGNIDGKYTYIDLDEKSVYYGLQLIPCVLDVAFEFDKNNMDLAECLIGDTWGYLPRNCVPRNSLNANDLLSINHKQNMVKYYNGIDTKLSCDTKNTYFNLTCQRVRKPKKRIRTIMY